MVLKGEWRAAKSSRWVYPTPGVFCKSGKQRT